jgi:O-antigen/teichoic acid export membrane protein
VMGLSFKPVLLLMFGRTIAFAISFAVPVVLVRILDPAAFGTYKQLFLIYATLFSVVQFGMAESLFYFLPLAPHKQGRYVVNSLLVSAGAGLACLGCLALGRSKISQWMNNGELSGYIPWVGIFLLLMTVSAFLEIVLTSRKRYLWASFSYGFSDLLRATFLLVPVLLFRDVEWLLLGAVTFAALRFCGALLSLWRDFGGELRPDLTLLKQQLTYAMPFQLAVLVETLQANFHQYAVSYHFDAATFAIYAVGCLQIPLVELLYGPAGHVMMVRMSEEMRAGRSQALLAIWHVVTRKLALVFFPLVGLLVVTANELIVVLFTESYRESVPIFMFWSTLVFVAAFPTDGVLRVYAATRFILLLNAVRLIFILASINWFVSVFHLSGAVMVTVIATFIGKGLALVRMKDLFQIGLAQLLPWRGLGGIFLAAAAAGLLALLVESMLDISMLPLLFITSFVYAVSYLTVLLRVNLLPAVERLAFTGWWQGFTRGATRAEELMRS